MFLVLVLILNLLDYQTRCGGKGYVIVIAQCRGIYHPDSEGATLGGGVVYSHKARGTVL